MPLFTLGYEGLTAEIFFERLIMHQVQTLIDIRELPISRKSGFSKSVLRDGAQSHHIAYVHLAALGCPRPIRIAYRSDKDWARYTQGFLAYLETQDAAIADLAERVTRERCCLLCFEADYHVCHRMFVANRVAEVANNGIEIVHLTGRNQAE